MPVNIMGYDAADQEGVHPDLLAARQFEFDHVVYPDCYVTGDVTTLLRNGVITMGLTNAERQKRYREKRNELARSAVIIPDVVQAFERKGSLSIDRLRREWQAGAVEPMEKFADTSGVCSEEARGVIAEAHKRGRMTSA